MNKSIYLLLGLFMFIISTGCQSLPVPEPESTSGSPSASRIPTSESSGESPAPFREEVNPYSLNTGKVDQMILDGKKPGEVLAELNKLEKDIKNDRQREIFHLKRGEIYKDMGENQKAVEEFETAANIKATKTGILSAYSHIASIYNSLGNLTKSVNYLDKASKIYPELKDGDKTPGILVYYASAAIINSDRGNFEESIRYLDSADELIKKFELQNPDYKESIVLERAFAYSMLKQPEKALKTVNNLTDISKAEKNSRLQQNRDLDDLEIRYKVAVAKGEYEKALSYTEELKEDDGYSIHVARGNVYYVWDKNDEARKEFELAFKKDKDPLSKEQASKMLKRLK